MGRLKRITYRQYVAAHGQPPFLRYNLIWKKTGAIEAFRFMNQTMADYGNQLGGAKSSVKWVKAE